MKELETAFAGVGDFGSFEDGHKGLQRFKRDGIAQIEAPEGQGKCQMSLANAGRPEETDVKRLFHPGHVRQAEHLFFGNAALKAKIEGIQRLFGGKPGTFPAKEVLFQSALPLLILKDLPLHTQKAPASV